MVTPGEYRHFKGTTAKVLAVFKHTETGEMLVGYEHPDENGKPEYWCRPLAMFMSAAADKNGQIIFDADGKPVPRFTRVSL